MRPSRQLAARVRGAPADLLDAALMSLLAAGWIVEVLVTPGRGGTRWITVVGGLLMIAPVAWRRRAPVAGVGVRLVIALLQAALGGGVYEGPHHMQGLGGIVLFYSVGAYRGGRRLVVGSLLAVATVLAHAALLGTPYGPRTVVSVAVFAGAPILTGWALRRRRRLAQRLEHETARLRQEREERARLAVAAERGRIARELHDVVTHSLTEMVVQAAAVCRSTGDAGRRMMRDIEINGRDALGEMRRLLGVLRGREAAPLAPQPTLAQLPALVERVRATGAAVELRIEGERDGLPAGVDLTAYRVVEEALGSPSEHADRRYARVLVRHRHREVELEIDDECSCRVCVSADGNPPAIAGIRERVELCRGQLRTRRRAAGGLALSASLPYEPANASRPERPLADATPGRHQERRIRDRDLLGRWPRIDPHRLDAALAVVFFAVLELDMLTSTSRQGGTLPNTFVLLAMAGAFAGRRRLPLAAVCVFMTAAAVQAAFLTPPAGLATARLAIFVAVYSAAAYTGGCRTAVAGAVCVVGVLAVMLFYGIGALPSNLSFVLTYGTVLPWMAGRAMRSQALLGRQLRDTAALLEWEAESRARVAVVETRRRIARELHDVVAHSLTVMVVQAGAARRAGAEPGRIEETAGLIERTGRDALTEMRRVLGALEAAEPEAELAPQPGLRSLDELVARTRAAGLPVELRREGRPFGLPAGLDLAAYRVLQEALTNAIKHAQAGRAEVVVRYTADHVELVVVDNGRGPHPGPCGPGHGLVGMRERVNLYGGDLEAGSGHDGGFVVRARIPAGAST